MNDKNYAQRIQQLEKEIKLLKEENQQGKRTYRLWEKSAQQLKSARAKEKQLKQELESKLAEIEAANKHLNEMVTQDKAIIDHMHEGVVLTNTVPEIISVNPAFSRITGYTKEEVVGKNPAILKSSRNDDSFFKNMWDSIHTRSMWKGEIWNKRKDGNDYPELLSISTIKDWNKKSRYYLGVFSDISELKRKEEEIRYLATHDELTSLATRRLLIDRLKIGVSLVERKAHKMAIHYMDLDGFKAVNDNYGHKIGDQLLIEVSRRMKKVLRKGDTLARVGGDEFILLQNFIPNKEDASKLAERILEVISQPFSIASEPVNIGVSIGICLVPDNSTDENEIIKMADEAMYFAKQQGKNNYKYY